MGAVVEIVGTAARTLTVFTDGAGFYSAGDLMPGFYTVKVSAASFIPAWRDKVGLHPGASTHLNITLNTLLNAMRVGPLRGSSDDDDWKWTLRSVANRPVLRVFASTDLDSPSSVASNSVDPNSADPNSVDPGLHDARLGDLAAGDRADHDVKASLSLLAGAGSGGYGSGSDMSTVFSLERTVFSLDRVGVRGNVGYGEGVPSAALRATYSHFLPDGSGASMAVSARRLAPSDPNLHNASLQALALAAADSMNVGDVLELKFGSELQTIQFLGRVTAFRPHAAVNLHLSPNTIVGYAYATSRPESRTGKTSDSAVAELDETDPGISVDNFATKLEKSRHQELNFSHRMGKESVQVAVFDDHVANTALIGTGEVTAAGGFLLPDACSGTFTYAGDTLNAQGLRLVLERRFASELAATLDYSYGGVLDLARTGVALQNAQQWIGTQRRQAIAAKLSGTTGRTHTSWIASYRWINGQALTPVDMFNASPGQADAFLNLFIRQPIPTLGFLPAHMDAMIDVRNLLAQGYVPVLGQDGQTVYLVQSARSVRGGVTINF